MIRNEPLGTILWLSAGTAAPQPAREFEGALRAAGDRLVGPRPWDAPLLAMLSSTPADLLLLTVTRLPAAAFTELEVLAVQRPLPVVVLVGPEGAEPAEVRAAIRASVAAYVVAGFEPHRLRTILTVAAARFAEEQRLRTQLQRAQQSLQDRKLIEQAKGLLMRDRGLSEPEAYRLLQRLAMERRKRLAEVAADVLKLAELLTPVALAGSVG